MREDSIYTKARFGRYVELIGDKTGRVLDLGCAKGKFASFLGDEHNYRGVEILPENVESAWRRGLDVTCHDLNDVLPFPSGEFDIVVAGEIIEHMPNVSSFLAEVNRVLRPDGIFVGSTPNATNPSHYVVDTVLECGGKMGGHHGHLYSFDRPQLKALFELNGMRITEFTGTTLLPVSKLTMRLNRWLGKKLSRLSTCLVFKAEKAGESRR